MKAMMISGCCFVVWAASTGWAADFYVSPTGDDAAAGTVEAPFASLQRARDAVREWRRGESGEGAVTIHVADGRYELCEPLVLESQDSGTSDSPVVYQAQPGARPVFSGGRVLGGWQAAEDGLWTTHVPEVAAGEWYFEQLCARSPEFGTQSVTNKSMERQQPRRKKGVRTGVFHLSRFRLISQIPGLTISSVASQRGQAAAAMHGHRVRVE